MAIYGSGGFTSYSSARLEEQLVIDAAAEAASALGPGFVATAVTDLATRLHAFEILVGPYAVRICA